MKKVALFTTGGTISSVYDPVKKTITPSIKGEDLLDLIAPYLINTEVVLHEVSMQPGPHLSPDFGWQLSKQIQQVLSDKKISGAVIVQGTDTLDEMSYLSHLLIKSEKPVIYTGSMKSSKELYMDAIGNLIGAIEIVGDESSRGKGVMVYVDETIHSARDVEKFHANKIDAFISPKGALGGYFNGEIVYNNRPVVESTYAPKHLNSKVALVKVCIGMEDFFIRACIDQGYEGIVLEGFGAGNVPPNLMPAIEETLKLGIYVVITSRCYDGRVTGSYNYVGGGADLKNKGVILGGDLSGQKARIKLMVLLGCGISKAEIIEGFRVD